MHFGVPRRSIFNVIALGLFALECVSISNGPMRLTTTVVSFIQTYRQTLGSKIELQMFFNCSIRMKPLNIEPLSHYSNGGMYFTVVGKMLCVSVSVYVCLLRLNRF